MIYSLEGQIKEKGDNFFVISVGGVGFKVFSSKQTILKLSEDDAKKKIFCFLYVREDQLELYGFPEEPSLKLFEMLNTVAGVGPKTALGILDIDSVPNIMAAILEKKSELLTKTSGIGKKTAERIILELQNRIKMPGAKALTETMDIDLEVEEALIGLGYSRQSVRRVLSELEPKMKTLEERLRGALKSLTTKK